MNFFGMVIVFFNLYYRVIAVLSNLKPLEVVFLNYFYYECFCWVNFDLSLCIDEMICYVLYVFVVYFGYLVVFVCIQQFCVRIDDNNYTIFLKDELPLKFGFSRRYSKFLNFFLIILYQSR